MDILVLRLEELLAFLIAMSDRRRRLSDFVDLDRGGGSSRLALCEEEGEVVAPVCLDGVVLLGSGVDEGGSGGGSGRKRDLGGGRLD